MKRSEFLEQLRKALEHDLNAGQIKEHIDYYDDYIGSEMNKGLSEEEVIAQLGDPWAIAKTILLSSKMSKHDDNSLEKSDKKPEVKLNNILLAIVLVIVLVTIISAAFGIIALVIRYAVPILLLIIIIRLFTNK